MPYDGSSNYTLPSNTAAVSGATIQSTKFNSITADIEAALNDLRYQNLNIIANLQTFMGSADLATARTNLGLAIGTNVQAYDADLTDLATKWAAASASGPASLQFSEDTDNGSNKVTVQAPSSVVSDISVTLPSLAGTLPVNNISDALTTGSIELGHATDTTLSRLAAGDVGIEGQQIISTKVLTVTAANQAAARTNISAALKGQIFGLTLSNNGSDATNDIDIAEGECASTETNPVLMVLASALTKRLDAAWAVGTNQGGLDTGSIANTTYHVWLIQRSDTGVVDALFSTSATSPTMPTNYDRKRRIGSIMRISAAIKAFKQVGDIFTLPSNISDLFATSSRADSLLTISVPTGIVLNPILSCALHMSAAGNIALVIGSVDAGSSTLCVAQLLLANENTNSNIPYWQVRTNTSAQIYCRIDISAGSLNNCGIDTHGWIDTRGKDA